jgi:hypothetical protein
MRHLNRFRDRELDMKGTVLALAAVLTLGSTSLGMKGMAVEWATADAQGALAGAPLATPGPAGQLWMGGTLPAIIVEAPAYSAVVFNAAEAPLSVPRRRA